MSIRHFLSPILRRFRSGGGGGAEMESGNENGCDDNDIFDVLDDKENQQRGRRITVTELTEKRCLTRSIPPQILDPFQFRHSPGTEATC